MDCAGGKCLDPRRATLGSGLRGDDERRCSRAAAGAFAGCGVEFRPKLAAGGARGGRKLGVEVFRDEVIWNHVEQSDGRLEFGSMREAYPEMLAELGANLLLLAYSGHPNWEEGHVPQDAEGQAAFANYQTRILQRFPAIEAIEIGNEFNSWEFAELEGWPPDLQARAEAYVDLLATTAGAVRAIRPEIEILGGAAHSVPVAWAEAVVAAGGLVHMDAFVLHPYTSKPEMIGRQIDVLRQVPGLSDMPIAITEFGTTDADQAPDYLVRMYCQMALGGVNRAIWYPFSPRGDGLVPIVDDDGTPTATGQAFALIRAHLEGRVASDVAPDPFTYACKFGQSALVIWGAPRGVMLAPGLRALNSAGLMLEAPLRLSRDKTLLILSDGPRSSWVTRSGSVLSGCWPTAMTGFRTWRSRTGPCSSGGVRPTCRWNRVLGRRATASPGPLSGPAAGRDGPGWRGLGRAVILGAGRPGVGCLSVRHARAARGRSARRGRAGRGQHGRGSVDSAARGARRVEDRRFDADDPAIRRDSSWCR